jgi:hypothetical protein
LHKNFIRPYAICHTPEFLKENLAARSATAHGLGTYGRTSRARVQPRPRFFEPSYLRAVRIFISCLAKGTKSRRYT